MDIEKTTLEIVEKASWYNQWLFTFIKPHLGKRVLEVGCGIGTFTSLLLKRERELVAIDVNRDYLDKVNLQVKSPHLTVMWADIERNKFSQDPGVFDTIICFNVLEHIENDRKALKNMFNLLKTEGKLLLLVPAGKLLNGSLDHTLGHKRRYSRRDLMGEIKEMGFEIEHVRFLNWLGAVGWFLNSRVLKRRILSTAQLSLFNLFARPF